jgi:hypothetical protein
LRSSASVVQPVPYRHCPKRQALAQAKWIAEREARICRPCTSTSSSRSERAAYRSRAFAAKRSSICSSRRPRTLLLDPARAALGRAGASERWSGNTWTRDLRFPSVRCHRHRRWTRSGRHALDPDPPGLLHAREAALSAVSLRTSSEALRALAQRGVLDGLRSRRLVSAVASVTRPTQNVLSGMSQRISGATPTGRHHHFATSAWSLMSDDDRHPHQEGRRSRPARRDSRSSSIARNGGGT